MMSVTLWKKDKVDSGVSLLYLGDAVVCEYNNEGRQTPHYFETKSQAVEFIIKQAFALLSLGYEVYEE